MTEQRVNIDWAREVARLRAQHPLERRVGWEHRLAGLIFAHREAEFAYGVQDCLLWAGAVVEAVTGCDFAGVFRHRYRTALGAARVLRACGAELGTLPDVLGFRRCGVRMAQRGDIALAADGDLQLYGVVEGEHVWVPGVGGVVDWPRERMVAAWAVGRASAAEGGAVCR